MSGPPKLKSDQVDQLVEWVEAGRTDQWIAQRLGVSANGVNYHRTKLGILSGPIRPVPELPLSRVRGGKPVRLFTQAEDRRILELRLGGATQAAIAADLGRAASSVYMRLLTLARHEEAA